MENVILSEKVRKVSSLVLLATSVICMFIVFDWWAVALLYAVDYTAFRWAQYEKRRFASEINGLVSEFINKAKAARHTPYVETEGGDHD